MTRLTPAQTAARDAARQHGKFGIQTRHESGTIDTPIPPLAGMLACDRDELWDLVESGDPERQIGASWNPNISIDQAVTLAAPSQPVETRLALAASVVGEVHDVLAQDPDAMVRFLVLRDSKWALEPADVARLETDPEVAQVASVFQFKAA